MVLDLDRIKDLVIGKKRENDRIDYKATIDLSKPGATLELAKDIAAFANGYGGDIIIGIPEKPKEVPSPDVLGIPLVLAEEVERAYRNAAQTCCSPRVVPIAKIHDLQEMSDADPSPDFHGRVLLVIHVDAAIHGLIGIRTTKGGDDWRFPIRTGSETKYSAPDDIPFFADPQYRRILVLVDRVIQDHVGATVRTWKQGQFTMWELLDEAPAIDYAGNGVKLYVKRSDAPYRMRVNVPLDAIFSVSRNLSGAWTIYINGVIVRDPTPNPEAATYRPG